MTNNLPSLPDDNSQFDETVQNQSQRRVPTQQPSRTPPPQQAVQRQPTNYDIQRVRQQRQRQQQEGVLYFPLWSLGLMLFIVMILAFGIVFLIVVLGGNSSVPQQDAVIRIVTQSASNTPDIPDPNEAVLATPTLPTELIVLPEQTPVNLNLDGPVLPTIAITNTPIPLSVGVRVSVINVGDQELNVRNVPGVNGSQVLFRVPQGTEFSIIDGPQQADGFTWWQIQDATTAQRGWAVANYLDVVQAGTGQ